MLMFYLKNKNKIQIGCCIIAIMILLTYYIVTINSDNSMADPNWGLLEKSQVDDETIEEAIDRLIAAHDNDADAHIGAGKSLNTHKTQETVDHPAGSIIEDKYADQSVPGEKFKFSQFKLETYFESIDAYTYKTDISAGITVTDWHRYKAIYTSGEKIEFYVDDVLKATHTTNLPEDGTDAADELNFFTFRIFTTETANKRLVLKYCVLQQDT